MIEYTAKRTLMFGHAENSIYSFDVEVVEATPQITDVKQSERSPSGATETTFERQDTYWTVQLAPVRGRDVEQLREFLDSTESGETFRVWLSPDDVAPLVLKREEAGHSESAFMRCGAADKDWFTGQFTALQSAPYDITGLQPGGGSGGYYGGGSDTTDIYDPNEGGPTGGLDVPVDNDQVLVGTVVNTSYPPPVSQQYIVGYDPETEEHSLFTPNTVNIPGGGTLSFDLASFEKDFSGWQLHAYFDPDSDAGVLAEFFAAFTSLEIISDHLNLTILATEFVTGGGSFNAAIYEADTDDFEAQAGGYPMSFRFNF